LARFILALPLGDRTRGLSLTVLRSPMSLPLARPDLGSLLFRLYSRAPHPELFEIRSKMRLHQLRWSAELAICDAGHVVQWQSANQLVCEVVTGGEVELPVHGRVLSRRMHGGCSESVELPAGVGYQVCFQVERLDPVQFLNLHSELQQDCARATLAHEFPGRSRLAPGPLSLLNCEAAPDSLLVHAFHTFPEQCAVVKVQSLLELRD